MVSVHEALETILDHAQPLGHETVELTHARGRILAQDILSDADLPGMPRSSVDGYAVIAGDDAADLDVLEEVTAGRLAQTQVAPGTAVRIMTGGTLPRGADAVVMVEEVDETNGRAVLQHRPRRGENVHPPGMDLTRSQHVLSARLSLEDASYVMRVLLSVEIFQKVVVQPDDSEDTTARPPSGLEDRPVHEHRRYDKIA